MTKKETLWREILHQAIKNKKLEFTQKELAQQFGFSLSTVFNALKVPRQSGAIKVTARNFKIQDAEKFLYLWATQRNIGKEIIYKTNVKAIAREIEGMMPAGVIFACYSAYTKKYKEAPADYDKVYVYADERGLKEIKKRFPANKGVSNLIVLKSDPYLKEFDQLTPDVQTFIDLWNLHD
jgi:predicted transcriptional regulator